jgi:hypothetical protein
VSLLFYYIHELHYISKKNLHCHLIYWHQIKKAISQTHGFCTHLNFSFKVQSRKIKVRKWTWILATPKIKKNYFFLCYFTFYFLILTTRLEFYQGTKCKIGRTSPKRVLLTWNDGNIRLDEATEPVTRSMFQRRGFDPLQRIADTDESLNHLILKWFMLVQIYRWQNPTRPEKPTRPVQIRIRSNLIF